MSSDESRLYDLIAELEISTQSYLRAMNSRNEFMEQNKKLLKVVEECKADYLRWEAKK